MASSLMRVGVASNLILAAAAAAAWASVNPLFGGADETAHTDYAFQVWLGRLPVFEEGLLINPSFGDQPPVQWTAQHPPLFYLLLAPFVGPLADTGNLLAAGYAGRAVNMVIAAGLVAAVMWAASALAPRRQALWLAAGTVAALYPLVLQGGGTVYNDTLFATWAALLVGLSARIIRSGPTARRVILFGLVAACALLTRSAAVTIIAVTATAATAPLLLSRPPRWRAIFAMVGAVGFAIAASAWFYLRNLRLTGNLVGGHFDYLTHRVERPLSEVLVRREVWEQLFLIHGYELLDRRLATLLVFGVPVVVACVLGVRQLIRRRRWLPDLASAVLLVGLVCCVLMMQLMYVSAGGGASRRYLAPLTVVFAYTIAVGLTAVRRLAPVLLLAWVTLQLGPLAHFTLARWDVELPADSAPIFPTIGIVAISVACAAAAGALLVQVGLVRRAAVGTAHPGPDEPYRPRRARRGHGDGRSPARRAAP